jgi:hypothetical protein
MSRRVDWELGGSDFGIEAEAGEGPVEVGIARGILWNDNLDAIQEYFAKTDAVTPEAVKIKDDFTKWIDGLWWYEKMEQSNNDLARNMRNRFNLANAVTPADKAAVQNIIKTGLDTEQLMGEPDRRLSSGQLPGPETPPAPPLIPSWALYAGAAVAGLAVIFAAKGAAEQAVKKIV